MNGTPVRRDKRDNPAGFIEYYFEGRSPTGAAIFRYTPHGGVAGPWGYTPHFYESVVKPQMEATILALEAGAFPTEVSWDPENGPPPPPEMVVKPKPVEPR